MINDYLTAYFGAGYTDGEIQRAADPADNGNQAPLVTEWTFNLGGELRYPVGSGDMDFVLRADYSYLGDTYWEPSNISVRSPINLLDMRVGVDVADNWSLMLWARNLTDERYNGEFSPGPAPVANFLWPAQPRRWGLSFIKEF
jgi:iron complex outermembrane receptor protein